MSQRRKSTLSYPAGSEQACLQKTHDFVNQLYEAFVRRKWQPGPMRQKMKMFWLFWENLHGREQLDSRKAYKAFLIDVYV